MSRIYGPAGRRNNLGIPALPFTPFFVARLQSFMSNSNSLCRLWFFLRNDRWHVAQQVPQHGIKNPSIYDVAGNWPLVFEAVEIDDPATWIESNERKGYKFSLREGQELRVA
jgi:hypothetical protein